MKQINEYEEISAADSDDWILIQPKNGGIYKKIKKSNLLQGLGSGGSSSIMPYPSGMALWLENGELADKSGNRNNAIQNSARLPFKTKDTTNRIGFGWDGTNTQEIKVNPFLGGATGATLFIVFSFSSESYHLIDTRENDSWWRYFGNGAGYFGTFLQTRLEGYPFAMPKGGQNLLSIHSNSSTYQVVLSGVPLSSQSRPFSAGDRFIIGKNGYSSLGSIFLILVYPEYIAPSSAKYNSITDTIYSNYTLLQKVEYVS